MKILISIINTFLLLTGNVFGQGIDWSNGPPDENQEKNTIYIRAGLYSGNSLLDGQMKVYFGGNKYNYFNDNNSGVYTLSYHYNFSRRISVGMSVGYEKVSGRWVINGGTSPMGNFKRQVFSIAPEVIYTYLSKHEGFASMYCSLGIGYSYSNEVDNYSESYYLSQYYNGVNSISGDLEFDNNKRHVDGHVTALGLRFGRKIAGFMEIGFGYKGVFAAGITAKF